MNKWYLGTIDGVPVELFVTDDYEVQYWTLDEDVPPRVRKAADRIEQRSKALRSWSGLNRMLAEEGWSNA